MVVSMVNSGASTGATIHIDDRVRARRLTRALDAEQTAGDLVHQLIAEERLPTHTFRRKTLTYALLSDDGALDPATTLAEAGITAGATIGLECPDAAPVWARVQQLLGRVENELDVEARRHGERIRTHVRDAIDETIDELAAPITRPIGAARQLADDTVRSATRRVTDDVTGRLDAIKARVLDEIGDRLRGARSTIDLRTRVRVRRDLRKLAGTGVLENNGEQVRRALRALAASGVERAAIVAAITIPATLGVAGVIDASGGDDAPPTATEPTTPTTDPDDTSLVTTTTASSTTTEPIPPVTPPERGSASVAVNAPATVDAGRPFTVNWSADPGLDEIELRLTPPDAGVRTVSVVDGMAAMDVVLGDDSPASVTIEVAAQGPAGRDSATATVAVNRPPHLAPAEVVVLTAGGPAAELDLGATDPDDNLGTTAIEIVDGRPIPITEPDQDGRIVIDPAELAGPGRSCVEIVAIDLAGLSANAWVEIVVLPRVRPGDSLWTIARRTIESEGVVEPTDAEIATLVATLRAQRWLVDPDLIFVDDSIVAIEPRPSPAPAGVCPPG